jgi:ABC-type phosphate transport system substrate-binding protein
LVAEAFCQVDPGSLSGNNISAGSSTVFPLAEAMANRFKEEGFTEDKGQITIDSVGTGGGFERFCVAGETDIANASRKIKDSELESCQKIGREPIQFRVGTDALAVVVSSENDFLTDVSKEELAKIFSSDAQKWSDVNPDWPAEDILRYIPGTDSGTFDYFVEVVMDPVYIKTPPPTRVQEAILAVANLNPSEDAQRPVQALKAASPSASSVSHFENQGKLKTISIGGTPTTDYREQ